MYTWSFLCDEAKIKEHTFSKKELCEIGEEAIWESRFAYFFYYLITYGVCKKRKYCNRMIEKKNLLLMNVHVFYILELKTSAKRSVCLDVCVFVCLSVCLHVCLLSRLQNFSGCTITFERVNASKKNLVGVFYV